MIKTEAANNMISYGLIQKLLEENKSIESFLNSNIKIDIALYNQSSLKFSNPMELHYTLSAFGDIERICSDILKNSNNTDIKEFVKNSCEMEKK
ncbi:MAG: hypothetical protein LBI78_00010 [Campylobacteraceae bacterium]|nr:hypothetical protein [Campylobacteraceae bacterium]